MLSANETYEKATKQISDKVAEELSLCEKTILKAIQNGEKSCYINQDLGRQTQEDLRWLGYIVHDCSDYQNGTLYQISWNLKAQMEDK